DLVRRWQGREHDLPQLGPQRHGLLGHFVLDDAPVIGELLNDRNWRPWVLIGVLGLLCRLLLGSCRGRALWPRSRCVLGRALGLLGFLGFLRRGRLLGQVLQRLTVVLNEPGDVLARLFQRLPALSQLGYPIRDRPLARWGLSRGLSPTLG